MKYWIAATMSWSLTSCANSWPVNWGWYGHEILTYQVVMQYHLTTQRKPRRVRWWFLSCALSQGGRNESISRASSSSISLCVEHNHIQHHHSARSSSTSSQLECVNLNCLPETRMRCWSSSAESSNIITVFGVQYIMLLGARWKYSRS
jgi:hypothetical protein